MSYPSNAYTYDDSCTFCTVSRNMPLFPPGGNPPAPPASSDSTDILSSHMVLSTPTVVAFLDILPLSPCHVLVCPRYHRGRLDNMSAHENADVAGWLPVIARAALKVSGYPDFNVVQNNGRYAAQVIPHVHYHIVPRPTDSQRAALEDTGIAGGRSELEEEEGERLAGLLRDEIKKELGGHAANL